MTEYWKSQSKHYCEFCSCWIADDKPSREMHEKGLRHQANVAKRIDKVKKNTVEEAKAKSKLDNDLLDIEKKAYIAFQQDVMRDVNLMVQGSDSSESKAVEESLKEKIKQDEAKLGEDKKQSTTKKSSDPTLNDQFWEEKKSPEGYIYFYNTKTKQKQWEKPECLKKDSTTTVPEASSASSKRSLNEDSQESNPGPGKIKLHAGGLLLKRPKPSK